MNVKGVLQAGAWNYLREEITVALECRRCTRINVRFGFDPSRDYSDSMRADAMSHMLARIINHCFQDSVRPSDGYERSLTWQSLFRELDQWKTNLPPSFEPFSEVVSSDGVFPSLWLLQGWHGDFDPA